MIPKVSVLMSVYNAEDTIRRSLQSLLDQKFSNYEIVIINDGSSDDTEAIIRTFKSEKIGLLSIGRMGLPKALNYGLKHCKGEYIARMDADDWSHPNRLALQSDFLNSNAHIGVVSSLVEYEGNRKQNLGYALHVDWINTLISNQSIRNKRFEDSPIANPSAMFRKELIAKYGNYCEEGIPEDYEYWLRLMHENVAFYKIDKYLLKWADLPSRITRTATDYSQENFSKVKSEYLVKWLHINYLTLPKIYVFGTGKSVNSKVEFLTKLRVPIYKFLDVKEAPYNNQNIMHYTDLPAYQQDILVLSYIGDRSGKQKVIDYLLSKGYTEGESFFMMS